MMGLIVVTSFIAGLESKVTSWRFELFNGLFLYT